MARNPSLNFIASLVQQVVFSICTKANKFIGCCDLILGERFGIAIYTSKFPKEYFIGRWILFEGIILT